MPHVPEPFGSGKTQTLDKAFDAIEKQIKSSNDGRQQLVRELQRFVKRAQKLLGELGKKG